MDRQQADVLVGQKLEAITRLLTEICEIADSQNWFDNRPELLLEEVNDWKGQRELHAKILTEGSMSLEEINKRSLEADLSSHAKKFLCNRIPQLDVCRKS